LLPLAFACLSGVAFAASLAFFLYSYLFLYGPAGGAPAGSAFMAAAAAAANVLLFTAFALHHSVFARTPVKRFVARAVGPRLERAVYTVVSSVLFAIVCWLWQPVPGVLYALQAPWTTAAYASLAAGLVVTTLGARALDPLELAGIRQVLHPRQGSTRGSPADAPPPLKTDGVYALVRHPVYFGWVLVVFGVPTMTMTRLTFALISIAYLAVAVPFEERSLAETYGSDYASYRQKVRWRMLPGLY